MTIEIDSKAAEGFVTNTGTSSRMKHIDLREKWVQMVRDLQEIAYKHVDGTLNKADPFTKIMQGITFVNAQLRIMTPLSEVK